MPRRFDGWRPVATLNEGSLGDMAQKREQARKAEADQGETDDIETAIDEEAARGGGYDLTETRTSPRPGRGFAGPPLCHPSTRVASESLRTREKA